MVAYLSRKNVRYDVAGCRFGDNGAVVYASKPRYAGQAPEACEEAGGALVFPWAQIKCTGQAHTFPWNSLGIYYMTTAAGFAKVPSIVVNRNGLMGGWKCVSGTDEQQGLGILNQKVSFQVTVSAVWGLLCMRCGGERRQLTCV